MNTPIGVDSLLRIGQKKQIVEARLFRLAGQLYEAELNIAHLDSTPDINVEQQAHHHAEFEQLADNLRRGIKVNQDEMDALDAQEKAEPQGTQVDERDGVQVYETPQGFLVKDAFGWRPGLFRSADEAFAGSAPRVEAPAPA